jgi:hypothetical protein
VIFLLLLILLLSLCGIFSSTCGCFLLGVCI